MNSSIIFLACFLAAVKPPQQFIFHVQPPVLLLQGRILLRGWVEEYAGTAGHLAAFQKLPPLPCQSTGQKNNLDTTDIRLTRISSTGFNVDTHDCYVGKINFHVAPDKFAAVKNGGKRAAKFLTQGKKLTHI